MTQPETPDLGSVTAMSEIPAPLPPLLADAWREAREFLQFYSWVAAIEREFLGYRVDAVLYVFLFEIRPGRADVDSWIWVIVGDVPPAYITCEAKNPYEALDAYVGAMEMWVRAARDGTSVADLIPVNVPATPANAAMLDSRLRFIGERILPDVAARL